MPFPANFDLANLNGANGFKLSGVAVVSVASAGDVNGDGFADVIVGAPGAGGGGASYLVFGKAGGFAANLSLSALDGTNGFKLSGVLGDTSGRSVASAGDVNGDGFDDLIVGALQGNQPGASYVVFGKAGGFSANLDLSTLDGTNGFKLSGEEVLDRTGASVASAGDVNGDGFADLIVGAPGGSLQMHSAGKSFVIFGKAGGFAANLNLSSLNGANGFQMSGVLGSYSGNSVASTGDINGDGFDDLIVGAYGTSSFAGASYVVFGKADGFAANLNLSTLNGSKGFKITGEAAFDSSGISVASAGDVNGDGFDDLIVGADGASPYGGYSGASYVVFGKAGGFGANLDLSTLNGANGFKLSGAAAYDHSGISVASAGDVNGDGFDDLIVGAYEADPHQVNSSGASYVVFGKAGGFGAELHLLTLNGLNGFKLSGVSLGDGSGFSVASAGDVNHDGFDDLIIGTHFNGAANASYVVFGVKPDTAVKRTGTVADQTLAGGDFKDVLKGLDGHDALWGHGGKDKLKGGDGDDTLRGGLGTDRLKGGADSDSFHFSTTLHKKKNVDKIGDFKPKDDSILLDNTIFTKLMEAGGLKGKFFEIGSEADDKNDYVIYDKETGALSYDADGSKNKVKAIEFAQLDDHLKLKADDILVV